MPNFEYMEENIFGVWPDETVWDAIHELADAEIMFINFIDEDEIDEDEIDEDDEFEDGEIIFNPDFIEKVYIHFGHCPCCDPAPVNFNVIYN